MKIETKDRIASRFLEWPLAHMLIRALLFSVWFRIGAVALSLLPLALFLSLAKIWRSTPAHVSPTVRMSALDWLQARALERAARNELSAGQIHDGLISYQMAVANDPGNTTLLRTFLNAVATHAKPPLVQAQALGNALWLLQLTETNASDLKVVVPVFQKYGWDECVVRLLQPRRDRLNEALHKAYLIALFNTGSLRQFRNHWQSAPSDVTQDFELRMYGAATTALLGIKSPTEDHELDLPGLFNDRKRRSLAARLFLKVCERRQDLPQYLATLEQLRHWNEDTLLDHVAAWRLLAMNGRRDEALRRARGFAGAPATTIETLRLAEAFLALGMRDSARDLLQRSSADFAFVDGLWIAYGNLLRELQDWRRVEQLAIELRFNKNLGRRLNDFSLLLEGEANLHQSRPGAAAAAFAKIDFTHIEDAELAFHIANALRHLGHDEIVRRLTPALQDLTKTDTQYSETLLTLAYDLKDPELLLATSERLITALPNNWAIQNNRAAALLLSRSNPPEALRLTFPLSLRFPSLWPIQINHATALLQNGRYEEADALLARIPASNLSDSERANYFLACVEILLHEKRFNLASTFCDRIDPNHLFPAQRETLQRCRDQLALPIAGN